MTKVRPFGLTCVAGQSRARPKLRGAPDVLDSMEAQAHGVTFAALRALPPARGTSVLVAKRSDADAAMDRYAAGDDAAFAQVYDALAARLYGYLVRQTREVARAEDLLQQTMLQIHRARSSFIPGAEVTPWAFAIARRLLVDSVRRGRREALGAEGEPDPGASPEPLADEWVAAKDLARRVESVLAKLPQSQRQAFELIKNEGLSVAEAAQVLGTTVAAVKLRAHRAYEALRGALGDAIGGFEGGNP